MNDIFRELKRGVDFDFGDNDAYTVVSQMLVEWCETRRRRFSDLIIKIKVGDYEDTVFESFDANNYCFVSDYDWWEGENTIQILDIKRLDDVFDDERYNISEDILGKTVQEAMTNIVSLYEKHSGIIIAHGDNDAESVGLHFKEGSGYFVSANPLINEVVYKFSISGTGYYLHIELWTMSVNEEFDITGAFIQLIRGEKVRLKTWDKGKYIELINDTVNNVMYLVDEKDEYYPAENLFGKLLIEGEWEYYKEEPSNE